MVVVLIVGILIAMLLPAIQSAREAARRTDCINRMRQLGIGLQLYEAQFRLFPPAATSSPPRHGVLSRICPFLELGMLSSEIDYSENWNSAGNESHTKTDIPLFLCPSAPDRPGEYTTDYVPAYKIDASIVQDFIDVGYTGPDPGDDISGMLQLDEATNSSRVKDGMSNTFMFFERAGQPMLYNNGAIVGN
ncbi:MAG: DUF1559 domain-containing protein, partial [Planctomycetales bacterium]